MSLCPRRGSAITTWRQEDRFRLTHLHHSRVIGRYFPGKNRGGKHTPSPFGSVAASPTFLNASGGTWAAVECLTVWAEPAERNAAARFRGGSALGSSFQLPHTHTHTGHGAIWDVDPSPTSIWTDTLSPVGWFCSRAAADKGGSTTRGSGPGVPGQRTKSWDVLPNFGAASLTAAALQHSSRTFGSLPTQSPSLRLLVLS